MVPVWRVGGVGVCVAAACYSDVLNVEVVPPSAALDGPADATPLLRRHRYSLQRSARPVIAPGALERPRRAVQRALGHTRRGVIVSRSGFDSDSFEAQTTS